MPFITQDKNSDFVWIGATDQEEEGTWKWTDCNPWNFTNWGSKQPDNHKGQDGHGENCAAIPSNKTDFKDWYDIPCHLWELNFVCTRLICTGEM